MRKAVQDGVCFVAGTMVLTNLGNIAIETVRAGDRVWAENPETGEKALKSVVQTVINQTDELVHVFAGGEEIVTTPGHPFYVEGKGWTESIQLHVGNLLILQDGSRVPVKNIRQEVLEISKIVYNFQVEDFNTYYVGENSILVHNKCNVSIPSGVSGLKYNGNETWTSTKGLIYGQDPVFGNRVQHVLEHLIPNSSKPTHTVFNVDKSKLIGLIDDAWVKKGVGTVQKNGNTVYNISMGKTVGTNGESIIRIVTKGNTSELVTAFPVK